MRGFFQKRRPGPQDPLVHLVLYSRRNCHLCDDTLRDLQKEHSAYDFDIEIIDIDSDPELKAKFGEMVPVIAVNNQIRLWGNIKPALLKRLIQGESQKIKPVKGDQDFDSGAAS